MARTHKTIAQPTAFASVFFCVFCGSYSIANDADTTAMTFFSSDEVSLTP